MNRVSASYFRHAIEEHFDTHELDVVCRKKRNAYSVYWADDHEPLAKLRPTGQDDIVEIFYWADDRWKPVTEFAAALPLEESLEYITDDPDDLFFEADEEDEGDESRRTRSTGNIIPPLNSVQGYMALCSLGGAVVGGAFSGSVSGGAWGALAGTTLFLGAALIRLNVPPALLLTIIAGIPVSLVASAGGVLGGGVNGAVSHAIWGPVCGILVAGLSVLVSVGGEKLARGIGFLAALALASRLVEIAQLRDHFIGLALAAAAAWLGATLYAFVARMFVRVAALSPIDDEPDEACSIGTATM